MSSTLQTYGENFTYIVDDDVFALIGLANSHLGEITSPLLKHGVLPIWRKAAGEASPGALDLQFDLIAQRYGVVALRSTFSELRRIASAYNETIPSSVTGNVELAMEPRIFDMPTDRALSSIKVLEDLLPAIA